jgi:hypothetical protein
MFPQRHLKNNFCKLDRFNIVKNCSKIKWSSLQEECANFYQNVTFFLQLIALRNFDILTHSFRKLHRFAILKIYLV